MFSSISLFLLENICELDKERGIMEEIWEYCPNCETEIGLLWDLKMLGYKAFCPSCGERLMLCDACQHRSDDRFLDDCNYSGDSNSCRFNSEK